ncbi:MAG: hypothetical protein NTZ60_00790 [Campylobacterales bacterium]|nr:hypothetical protein [Campylobacterales bacterium]
MNKFEEELQKLFPNTKIIKLKDITTKIATISKVRIGQTRTFSEYDEISLNDLDAYGVITVPENPKYLGPANYSSIGSQRLLEGDVVLTHRGSVFKVGVVGSEYKKVIVGNNSMIRIQFPHARNKYTPLFVQAYLQLPFVKEYLNKQITCGSKERKILSSANLAELPIPEFEEKKQTFDFLELYYDRISMTLQAQKLLDEAARIIKTMGVFKESVIFDALNKSDEMEVILARDKRVLVAMGKLRMEMEALV